MKLKTIHKAFIREFDNSYSAIFKLPDGTIVETNGTNGTIGNDYNSSYSAVSMNGIGHMVFFKGDYSSVFLYDIVGTIIYFGDFSYKVTSQTDSNKTLEIYNDQTLLATVYITYHKGKYKKIGKDIPNELVDSINKEYTFRLPDGRVIIGVDTHKYEHYPILKYIIQNMEETGWYRSPHAKERLEDKNVHDVLAFIVNEDFTDGLRHPFVGRIDMGLLNSRTGEYILGFGEIDELSEENKNVIHRYKDKYLETLQEAEKLIIHTLDRLDNKQTTIGDCS